ncbi:MAG TPA: hypothetical protein VJ878_01500 [Candidatus Izemoplasmatales bacterium]|nr:hypothetical protein [Candidatus Izemoplasmatales bacterium]
MYPSSITFLYYKDYAYGINFIKEVLGLTSVMNQGFAEIFQLSQTSYLGVVSLEDRNIREETTLISVNTNTLEADYKRVKDKEVVNLKPIKLIEKIPLKSFFFNDKEGHRFEIQEFIQTAHLLQFNRNLKKR